MSTYKIAVYQDTSEGRNSWDDFVQNHSMNGTFLQTRHFLNYHPVDRFEDNSLIVLDDKKHIVAVIPGCVLYENGRKIFHSHKGSTYGGLIISEKIYIAKKLSQVIEMVETYLKENEFEQLIYKNTPALFSKNPCELLEYLLFYAGYSEEKELNLWIDYSDYKQEIIHNFSQGKRGHVRQGYKAGLELFQLSSEEQIYQMYQILKITLEKYNLKPVHTVEELITFKNQIISDECGFYGLYLGQKMIAASLMFYFKDVQIAHSQYLCALPEYNDISAMTYLYYSMIYEMKKKGYRGLSWGITTEHGGHEINWGLTQSKESYGSKYAINRVFKKIL